MNWNGWMWVAVAGCLAVVTTAQAVGENPYQKVVERNVFGLKPVPPPPAPAPPPPPPIPKITLQGITSILGMRQVLFKALTSPSPGVPPREKSYMLTEGQREDDFEVLDISLSEGLVKFKNHGMEQILDMKTDSAKTTPGAALAPTKAPLPVPVFAQNQAGEGGNAGLRNIPQRQVRTEPEEQAAESSGTGESAAAATPVAPQVEAPPIPEEQQPIIIELNRERIEEDIRSGRLSPEERPPPLPPTELTPPGSWGVSDPAGSSGEQSGDGNPQSVP